MENILKDIIFSDDRNVYAEICISKIFDPEEGEEFYYSFSSITINGCKTYKKKITHLSKILCLAYSMSWIGNTMRWLSYRQGINFDLEGLTFDDYFPLPKGQREAWDE